MKALQARIERLEAATPRTLPEVHRYIQNLGETAEAARARYEQESARGIGPTDLLIIREII